MNLIMARDKHRSQYYLDNYPALDCPFKNMSQWSIAVQVYVLLRHIQGIHCE